MLRKRVSTRRRPGLECLEDRLCLSTLPVATSTTVPDAATQAHLTAAYGQLPLSFEINKGQTDPRVNFLTQGAGYTAFLTPNERRDGAAAGQRRKRRDHEDSSERTPAPTPSVSTSRPA